VGVGDEEEEPFERKHSRMVVESRPLVSGGSSFASDSGGSGVRWGVRSPSVVSAEQSSASVAADFPLESSERSLQRYHHHSSSGGGGGARSKSRPIKAFAAVASSRSHSGAQAGAGLNEVGTQVAYDAEVGMLWSDAVDARMLRESARLAASEGSNVRFAERTGVDVADAGFTVGATYASLQRDVDLKHHLQYEEYRRNNKENEFPGSMASSKAAPPGGGEPWGAQLHVPSTTMATTTTIPFSLGMDSSLGERHQGIDLEAELQRILDLAQRAGLQDSSTRQVMAEAGIDAEAPAAAQVEELMRHRVARAQLATLRETLRQQVATMEHVRRLAPPGRQDARFTTLAGTKAWMAANRPKYLDTYTPSF